MNQTLPPNATIQLTELLSDRLRIQYQTFQEESEKSDRQFDKSNDIQYYIISTKFIQQWKEMIKPIIENPAPEKTNIEIRTPQPMNLELVQNHLTDFEQYELKRDIQQGRDFKLYNNKTMSLFQSYAGAIIPRRAYYSGVEKKVQLHPIKFQFIYMSKSWVTLIQKNSQVQIPVYTSLGYKNQTILDLLYRLVQYSKKDKRNKDPLYINNAAAKMYLGLNFDPQQYTKILRNQDSDENLQPPGAEINSSKMIGELEMPSQRFLMIVQLQENKWVYKNDSKEQQRCEFCRSFKILKIQCKCKQVKYCSQLCKQKDWKYHSRLCDAQLQQENTEPQFIFKQNSRRGLVGLSNIGNTCFMNSALQCMIHTTDLTEYFRTKKYKDQINQANPIGSKGKLVKSYAKFIQSVLVTEQDVVTPSRLKYTVGKTKEMFSGFQQHDSQQFLLFMLDTLHEDLNRVISKPLTSGVENQGRPDEVVARESWITYLKRNQSIINDLMGGQYRSEVKCPDCHNISVTFDPYLIFAVPIPSTQAKSINLYYFQSNFNSDTLKISLSSRNNLVKQLKEDLVHKTHTPAQQILFVISGFNGIVRIVDENQTVDRLTNQKQLNQNSEERQLFAVQYQLEQLQNLETKKFLVFKFVSKDGKAITFKKVFPMRIKNLKGSQLYNRICEYTLNLWIKSQRKMEIKQRQTKLKVFKIKIEEEKLFKIYMAYGKPVEAKNKLVYENRVQIQADTNVQELLVKNNFQVQFEVEYAENPNYGFNSYKSFRDGQSSFSSYDDGAKTGSDQKYTLYQCLQEMKKSQKLVEGNQVFCSKCGDLKLAEKKMQLYKASKYLIIQLRRFKQVGYQKSKNYASIEFPIDLDLENYILTATVPQTYFIDNQEFFIKPKYWEGYNKSTSTKYKLYGVVNHHGSLAGGHYTAFASHEGKWYKFDDSEVTQVQPHKVVTSSAYILFYEKQQ